MMPDLHGFDFDRARRSPVRPLDLLALAGLALAATLAVALALAAKLGVL